MTLVVFVGIIIVVVLGLLAMLFAIGITIEMTPPEEQTPLEIEALGWRVFHVGPRESHTLIAE